MYLGYLILTLLVLDLNSKTLFLPIKFYVGNYMLLLEILTNMLQTGYDTMLFQIGLFHFGTILRHLLQISLVTIQIIVGLLVELGEFDILLLQVLSLLSGMFYLFQLIGQVLVFMLDLIQLFFNYDQFFVTII